VDEAQELRVHERRHRAQPAEDSDYQSHTNHIDINKVLLRRSYERTQYNKHQEAIGAKYGVEKYRNKFSIGNGLNLMEQVDQADKRLVAAYQE
jgi:hypothetical protein